MRYNQHLLIQRAPTLHPGPCLVFLDLAKKGLRYPNLKSKTSLLLQLKLTITSSHQSHQHHLSLQSAINYLCSCSSAHHLCSSSTLLIVSISAQVSLHIDLCCLSILLVICSSIICLSAHHCCWSSAHHS